METQVEPPGFKRKYSFHQVLAAQEERRRSAEILSVPSPLRSRRKGSDCGRVAPTLPEEPPNFSIQNQKLDTEQYFSNAAIPATAPLPRRSLLSAEDSQDIQDQNPVPEKQRFECGMGTKSPVVRRTSLNPPGYAPLEVDNEGWVRIMPRRPSPDFTSDGPLRVRGPGRSRTPNFEPTTQRSNLKCPTELEYRKLSLQHIIDGKKKLSGAVTAALGTFLNEIDRPQNQDSSETGSDLSEPEPVMETEIQLSPAVKPVLHPEEIAGKLVLHESRSVAKLRKLKTFWRPNSAGAAQNGEEMKVAPETCSTSSGKMTPEHLPVRKTQSIQPGMGKSPKLPGRMRSFLSADLRKCFSRNPKGGVQEIQSKTGS